MDFAGRFKKQMESEETNPTQINAGAFGALGLIGAPLLGYATAKQNAPGDEAVIDRAAAIVLPTAAFTAIPVAEVDETDMRMSSHTRFGNYLSLAALAVPMSLTPAGLPTSLQIVVRRFDDPLALRIGTAFEKVRGVFSTPQFS